MHRQAALCLHPGLAAIRAAIQAAVRGDRDRAAVFRSNHAAHTRVEYRQRLTEGLPAVPAIVAAEQTARATGPDTLGARFNGEHLELAIGQTAAMRLP